MTNSRFRTARLAAEVLEDRSVPAVLTYVNDTWHLFHDADNSGGLSLGDLVSNGNDGGTLTAFTYGAQAFGTVTSGPGISGPTSVAGSATINDAIAATDVGGTVNVLAGTYAERANVNKTLTLLGARAGVDARTRTGAETVIDGFGNNGETPIAVLANNVVVDGFTVQGATNGNTFGFGILLGAGFSGAQVLNNIVQNNIAGLSLANNPAGNLALISQNLFRNNNQPGPVSGTAIYTDQFNAGFGTGLANVVIDSNAFTGNAGVAVTLGSTQAGTQSNITVSNNTMTGNGNGLLAFNLTGSSLTGNTITGSAGSQVAIGGGVDGLTVSGNVIAAGAARGIRIGDFGGGSPNQNVTVTNNSITGNQAAGLEVADYTGTLDASGNWWGTATGPTVASNPSGTGQAIVDAGGVVDYSPWLATGTDTSAAAGFQGDFAQLVVNAGSPRTAAQVTAGTNNLQEGIDRVTVGGTVTATAGTYIENVTINKNLTLLSATGRSATTIQGVPNGALGTVVLTGNTTAVTLGGAGQGFTIVGIDNGNPGIENAALYLQGGHTGTQIRGNDIRANGDHGLVSEFGAAVSGIVIDGNIFSGQTFLGAAPATGNQFVVPNVARQLVVFGAGGGSATGPATNITFTNNQITGTAGAAGAGNSLVTLDVANSTISGNTFAGATSGFGAALRVRRPGTTISGNTFNSANMTAATEHLFVQNNTTPLEAIVAANTFDRGAYVNGGSDLSVSLAGGAGRAADGSTLRILAGTYVESLDLTAAGVNKGLTLAPIGTVTVNGDLTLDANDTLDLSAGQLSVTGTLTLGGATLIPALGGVGAVPPGGSVVIVNVPGTAPVTGTFAGLPQGGTVTIGGQSFTISYTGGDGNDIALTAPAPQQPPAPTGGSSAPTTPAASPVITGGMVANGLLMVFGAGGQFLTAFPVPPGTLVFFADFTGDGNGDLLVVTPGLAFLLDGLTGGLLAVATDLNGDRFADILLFSLTTGAPQTLILGGTGQVFSF